MSSNAQKVLLLKSCLLLIALRALLKILPFDKLYGYLRKLMGTPTESYRNHLDYTNQVIRSVEKCGRHLLRTRCLAQALAVQLLLSQKAIVCELQLGVTPGRSQNTAHAWLVAGDRILTGDNDKVHLYMRVNYVNPA